MREPPNILEEHLRTSLQTHYNFYPVTLTFLPIGLDYNAGVYRVVSEQGNVYLLKVKSGALYEPSCVVPLYLHNQGITSVVAPVPSIRNALWTRLDDWTVILYPFIDGDTSWTGMTDEHWKAVGAVLKRIHQVAPPFEGCETLRKETFDPTDYIRWIHTFEAQHLHEQHGDSTSAHTLKASWLTHRPIIHIVVEALEMLANVLQSRPLPYVICHADLHPANMIRDHHGRVFVIDWDEVMLAPKERDFLFVKDASNSTSAFFQGYGHTDIDWVALTYYRYERVIQDLIACAQEVFFRDDLGEGTKTDSVQLFQAILTEGGEIDAAAQAATHLPSDLVLPTRMVMHIERELAAREHPDT